MSRIAERVKELVVPIATQHGVEVWDVEFVKEGANWVLRVFLDSEAGISHAECEAVSRDLDVCLDPLELVDHPYMLEVSSPGAERALRGERDFARYLGRTVLVTTFVLIGGKKEWTGELLECPPGVIRLGQPAGPLELSMEQVSLVRLVIDLSALKAR